MIARLRDDGLAHVAVDEEPRAVFREPFERLAKLLVAESRPRYHRLAVRREDAGDALARGEDRGDHGEEIGLELGKRKSLARRAHRGLDQALHRQRAQRLVHGEEAGHDTRRRARSRPDMELLLGRTEIGIDGIDRDLACGAALQRRLDEKVEQRRIISPFAPRHEEAAASGRGEHGLGDEGHEDAGKGRVKGVAAILENFRCGARGQLMSRSNDAFALGHARGLRGTTLSGKRPWHDCHARERGHPVTTAVVDCRDRAYWIAGQAGQ